MPSETPVPKEARKYVVDLTRKLHKGDLKAQYEVADALGEIGGALQLSVDRLAFDVATHPDAQMRRHAANALQRMGPSAERAVPMLLKALDDKDDEVRTAVVAALSAMGPFAQSALPKLTQLLGDKNRAVRVQVVALVGEAAHLIHPIAGQGLNLGIRDVAVLAELVIDARRLGRDIGDDTVLASYQQWRRFDTLMLAAVTVVLAGKGDKALRRSAAYGIGFFGTDARSAVPHLVELLKSKDVEDPKLAVSIRVAVVWALGRIGPGENEAVPLLQELTASSDDTLRTEAMAALKRIAPPK